MNINLERHKTLKILSDNYLEFYTGQRDENFKLGKNIDDVIKELNHDRNTCELIFSKLRNEEEISFTNADWKSGLRLTNKGLESFSNKKYIKENKRIIKNNIKDLVQIIIPVLSLIIAFLAISLKINNLNSKTDKEIQVLKQEQALIKKNINKLENQTEFSQNDSLKVIKPN